MTAEDKSKRLASIKEQAEGRQQAKAMPYWMTRDKCEDGSLTADVSIWLARPRWIKDHPGLWTCDVETVMTLQGVTPTRYAVWTTAECLRTCKVYPETERESIHVGISD